MAALNMMAAMAQSEDGFACEGWRSGEGISGEEASRVFGRGRECATNLHVGSRIKPHRCAAQGAALPASKPEHSVLNLCG